MKVLNAFSLQVIAEDVEVADFRMEVIAWEQASKILKETGVESYIGHQDSAVVASNLLGVEIPMERRFATLVPGEQALIIQVVGGRLPEGSTTLPEGVRLKVYLVTYVS